MPRLDSFEDERSEDVKEFNVKLRPDDEMRGSLSLDIDVVEFMRDPQTYPEVHFCVTFSSAILKLQYLMISSKVRSMIQIHLSFSDILLMLYLGCFISEISIYLYRQ